MTLERETIDVKTPDGVARAWIHRDGRHAGRPAVLLCPDALGARPAAHAMAERLAGLGYVVMLPDLFYRAGHRAPFNAETVWSTPPERERLMALLQSLTLARMAIDAGAYLEALAAQPDVRADRIGITGYCIGGRLAIVAAIHHPDRVRAAASFHGGGLVTDAPDSPHRFVDRIRATVYLGVADADRGCTPEHQGVLAAALAAADVDYRIELYKGKKHGFAVADHAGAYDRDAAERHWQRLESLFSETIA